MFLVATSQATTRDKRYAVCYHYPQQSRYNITRIFEVFYYCFYNIKLPLALCVIIFDNISLILEKDKFLYNDQTML